MCVLSSALQESSFTFGKPSSSQLKQGGILQSSERSFSPPDVQDRADKIKQEYNRNKAKVELECMF